MKPIDYEFTQTKVDTLSPGVLKSYLDGNTNSEIDFVEMVWSTVEDLPSLGGGGSGSLPNGGILGQLLVKQSVANGDALWEDLILSAGGA